MKLEDKEDYWDFSKGMVWFNLKVVVLFFKIKVYSIQCECMYPMDDDFDR